MLPARRLADFWYFVVTGSGRARVLARREQVCIAGVTRRSIGSILGFENDGSRGRDPSHALGPTMPRVGGRAST